MNNRQLYMEKKNIVHTPEEFLEAFDNNTVIVFELAKEREPSDKYKLLSGIWDINPDALMSENCDLCVMSGLEPTAHRKQILIIDKGDKDTGNRILDLMYKSGVVPYCHVTFKEKKNGIKRCVLQAFNSEIKVVKKMNLLVDYGTPLVTVRHLSQADHDTRKEAEAK